MDSEEPIGFNHPSHSNWSLEIVVEENDDLELHPRKKQKGDPSTVKSSKRILVNSLILARQSEFFRYMDENSHFQPSL